MATFTFKFSRLCRQSAFVSVSFSPGAGIGVMRVNAHGYTGSVRLKSVFGSYDFPSLRYLVLVVGLVCVLLPCQRKLCTNPGGRGDSTGAAGRRRG